MSQLHVYYLVRVKKGKHEVQDVAFMSQDTQFMSHFKQESFYSKYPIGQLL
jgi:hypothetical protein